MVKEPHFSGHRERDASETSPDGTCVCYPLLPVQCESVQAQLAGKKEKQLKSDRFFLGTEQTAPPAQLNSLPQAGPCRGPRLLGTGFSDF